MEYKLTTLKNGFRIITIPLPNLESAAVTLWTGVGSRFEEESNAGLSHFLEHMVFKGSKKFPSPRAVSIAVDSIGADTNAGTSHEYTDFYIKCQKGQIKRSFDILSDIVLHPLLKNSDINREKGVIIEEISMHRDNPMEAIGDIFTNLAFAGNTLGRDIIGSAETVSSMSRDDFEEYRKKHYHAGNMILTASGNIDEKEIVALAESYFGDLDSGEKEEVSHFEVDSKNPRLKVQFKETEQAHLLLGFYAGKRSSEERYAEGILATILGKGMSSRLFTEVREKRGLAYAVGTSVSRFVDTGMFTTYAGVAPKNTSKVISLILSECYGIANGKNPILEKEFKKAKEFIKGKTALALEDTVEVNEYFGQRALFLPEIQTPEEFFKRIDDVRLEEVIEAAKRIFVPERLNIAVIGPYKDEALFKSFIS